MKKNEINIIAIKLQLNGMNLNKKNFLLKSSH